MKPDVQKGPSKLYLPTRYMLYQYIVHIYTIYTYIYQYISYSVYLTLFGVQAPHQSIASVMGDCFSKLYQLYWEYLA